MVLLLRLSLLFLDSKVEGNNRIHSFPVQRFLVYAVPPTAATMPHTLSGQNAPGPQLACPTGSQGSRANRKPPAS
jgi:hypothetical protein